MDRRPRAGMTSMNTTPTQDLSALINGPYHEPPEQGGLTYYCCEVCGIETLRRSDLLNPECHFGRCEVSR